MNRTAHTALFALVSILLAAFLAGCSSSSHKPNDKKRVLLVLSDSEIRYKHVNFRELFKKYLEQNHLDNVEMVYEYLDCELYDEQHEIEYAHKLIKRNSLNGQKIDMIIAMGDPAHYSLLCTEDPLTYKVPFLICGVHFPNMSLLEKHNNITGCTDFGDVVENIKVAKELTGSGYTFTILDWTFLDRKTREMMNEQLSHAPEIINNLGWKYSVTELLSTYRDSLSITPMSLRMLSSNTKVGAPLGEKAADNVVFTLRRFKDLIYVQMKYDGSWIQLARFSNYRPMITGVSRGFGAHESDYIGGYFASEEQKVSDIVGYMAKVFSGIPPSQIPIRQSKKQHYIDWNAAKKFGYHYDDLPKRYTIINTKWSDRNPEAFRALSFLSFAAIVILISLTMFMFWNERREKWAAMKRAERENDLFNMVVQESLSFAWENNGKELIFNDSFWKYAKIPARRLAPADFLKLVHPDYLSIVSDAYAQLLKGRHHSIEILADIDCDGVYHWYQIKGRGLLDAQGRFEKCYGMISNIDDFKKRETKLEEARRLAEEARLKESFLANMSHEIRTPLNAICGFSELLASDDMEYTAEEKQTFIETIKNNNVLLLKLINDILDLSRVESGQMEFDIKQYSVRHIIDMAYNTAAVQMPQHIEFKLQQPDLDISIMADDNRLRQVLTNFLTNAGKFTHQGSVTLGWEYDPDSGMVEMYVEDTGIGLSEDDQKMVFSRFYKKNEFKQGTGLGLSICSAIIENLGGTMKVKSQLGKGSRFSVFLKACSANA